MDRRELIEQQSSFYKIAFRKLINFTFFMLLLIFLAMALIIYSYLNRRSPTYFITTVDGRLIEIQAINKP